MKNDIICKIMRVNLWVSVIILLIGFAILIKEDIQSNNFLVQLTRHTFATTVLDIGILFIIINPVLRIILELYFFIKEKNYMYISICLMLFVIIVISIVA